MSPYSPAVVCVYVSSKKQHFIFLLTTSSIRRPPVNPSMITGSSTCIPTASIAKALHRSFLYRSKCTPVWGFLSTTALSWFRRYLSLFKISIYTSAEVECNFVPLLKYSTYLQIQGTSKLIIQLQFAELVTIFHIRHVTWTPHISKLRVLGAFRIN